MAKKTPKIEGYHAHVYYDTDTKKTAARLRRRIGARFDTVLGRWHDEPLGPHPVSFYQVAFEPNVFAELVPWMALNREDLTILVHPETGDDLADHSEFAMWLGDSFPLRLERLRQKR
ncbi:MAG: DOPA 4,5-dioxygenase family protein [Alphaproteobacteria bacterium]|nr:DOPA 4,5-dioxygenase family protein [Alphaproteobacteria bacterium]